MTSSFKRLSVWICKSIDFVDLSNIKISTPVDTGTKEQYRQWPITCKKQWLCNDDIGMFFLKQLGMKEKLLSCWHQIYSVKITFVS
jgi:hypothetical protein